MSDRRTVWTDRTVGFGWRGPADGAGRRAPSPHAESRSGLAVTASARLDERTSLCAALGIPQPERAGLPDSALVLRAYERWGSECPQHLLGDYAFAVWDRPQRTLFCARDHVGIRPFFYTLTPDRFLFASDVGALLAAPGVSDELDERAFATRLASAVRPLGAHTLFRAVRRLPPGHSMTVTCAGSRIERWWCPENVPAVPIREDDVLAEALRAVLRQAVADRVRGAHRVGVHLSGGLDSSGIAAFASRALRGEGRPAPPAFSWQGPPGGEAGTTAEHRRIEAVCRREGLRVVYCPPAVDQLVAYLGRDGARDLNRELNEEAVFPRAAELGTRVLLSGWGGDEGISFHGFGYYPELLREGRLGKLWQEMGKWGPRRPLAILAHAALPLAFPRTSSTIRLWRNGRGEPFRRGSFVRPEFGRRAPMLPRRPPNPVAVRMAQISMLQRGHLAERMDGWATAGAHYGVEYRYPLLDRRVLEFALGLPAEQFRRAGQGRWLMRYSLRSLLPAEVWGNRDKSDPSRSRARRHAVSGALSVVRGILDSRLAPPSRARYIDMPPATDSPGRGRWAAERTA